MTPPKARYTTETIQIMYFSACTRVSFELYDRDWLKLEGSGDWEHFCKILLEYQMPYIRKPLIVAQD